MKSITETACFKAFKLTGALYIAIGWRYITPTTADNCRLIGKTGGTGRIEYG